MSRVGKRPIPIPKGISVEFKDQSVAIQGPRGKLHLECPPALGFVRTEGSLSIAVQSSNRQNQALSGTIRAIVANMVEGVSRGFERRLELVGVGYRAQIQGRSLQLTLGYSKPVIYPVPPEITIETPSQTEIVIKGCDRQRVGQVAAEIRSLRRSDPYKGKGVRYAGEVLKLKETKKK
jgi:large subunit ribosomal protein L6